MARRKSRQGTMPKGATRDLEVVVYRTLALHGPLAGVAIAALLEEPPRRITNALTRLRRKGAIVKHGRVPRTDFSGHWQWLWQIVTASSADEADEADLVSKIRIDDADLAWMRHHRAVAEARQTRKAAINEVRARV